MVSRRIRNQREGQQAEENKYEEEDKAWVDKLCTPKERYQVNEAIEDMLAKEPNYFTKDTDKKVIMVDALNTLKMTHTDWR